MVAFFITFVKQPGEFRFSRCSLAHSRCCVFSPTTVAWPCENCTTFFILTAMAGLTEYYSQFFTATILEWKQLLKKDRYKDIIVSSLQFLVQNKRVAVYGFVIMPNHIHIIWQIAQGHKREHVQRDFLKFTAQQIKMDLQKRDKALLESFKVNAKDRMYQIWERNPLSIDIYSEKVMLQKLQYIHQNPLQERWRLSNEAEGYRYSSAQFYSKGNSEWKFLSHYLG